jgi:hypothetical protein
VAASLHHALWAIFDGVREMVVSCGTLLQAARNMRAGSRCKCAPETTFRRTGNTARLADALLNQGIIQLQRGESRAAAA